MSNIVNQLRKNSECLAPSIMIAAAHQIERQDELIDTLRQQIATLTAERDEARREILLWVKDRCSWVELTEEIKKRGWEYLKEDGK